MPPDADKPLPTHGYWALSQQPLHALIFLLPLVAIYEIGTLLYVNPTPQGHTPHILAYSMLQQFFEAVGVGVGAYYLPGLIVVVVLLCLHITRGDKWRIRPGMYPWMGVESLALALPLFFLMLLGWGTATPQMSLQAADTTAIFSWQEQLVYSVGAGIYEELLFRLIAIALIHMTLVDLLALPDRVGAIGAVAGSAVLFALYHFGPGNPFDWSRFTFYTLAGLYFAGLYLLRGFGIVAGVHAMYDILVAFTQLTQHTGN